MIRTPNKVPLISGNSHIYIKSRTGIEGAGLVAEAGTEALRL